MSFVNKETFAIKMLNWLISTLGIAVLIIAFWVFGPWIETTWYPVYSKFQIIRVEKMNDQQTKVTFKYTKNRACDPQGSAWFFGEPGAATCQIRLTVERPLGVDTVIRPIGTYVSNPFVMDVSIEQLASATFAEIWNNCHPFWLTRSKIYP